MSSSDEMPSGNMEGEQMGPPQGEESEMPSGDMNEERTTTVKAKKGDEMPSGDMNKD
jgi:hypothetical protein